MIEAQIICCEKCDIPDLGLNLVPGEEQWVSDVVARDSKDLQRAKVAGKVRVYRKTRRMSQTPKRPAPPFVLRSMSAPHKAMSTGSPRPGPDRSLSMARSCTENSWLRGSRSPTSSLARV